MRDNRSRKSEQFAAAVTPRHPPPATRFVEHRRAEIDELVRAGELTRIRRGVYLPPVDHSSPSRRREGEVLNEIRGVAERLTTDYVFSHTSAALLHGCWVWRLQPEVHVSQSRSPKALKASERSLRRHHVTIQAGDRGVVGGLPVTSIERTVVDCASLLPPAQAIVIADSGLRLGADPDELRRIIGSKRHTRGIRQARLVVDRATVQSESPGESIVRWFVINSGLPEPASQVKVDTHRGPKWIDLGWPERKIGIEFDGMGKYRDRDDLLAEKQRQDALAEAGWTIIRVTWDELDHPERLMARIKAALSVHTDLSA